MRALRDRADAMRAELARRKRAQLALGWRAMAVRWQEPRAFEAFIKLTWPVIEPKTLEWAPYMGVVANAQHRQMLGDPDHRRLLINLPPGFAKSILVSVMAPAYEWLFNPGRRKVFFSASDNVAIRDSRRTRILIQSDVYQDLLAEFHRRHGFPRWTLAFDQNQKANFENSARGFRQCLTLDSRVIGSRGDDQVIDDPVDVKEVERGTAALIGTRMKQVNDTIEHVLSTRINDRREARRTLVMQRLHPEDPAGRAIHKGGWKVICLPLRYDPDHPQVCPEDPRATPGELLHPGFLPEAEARALEEELGAAQASGQLQQIPGAGGSGLVDEAWFERRWSCRAIDLASRADEVWLTNDSNQKPGINNADSDWQVWARTGAQYDLLDWTAKSVAYPEFERTTDEFVEKWQPYLRAKGGALIEDTAHGATYLQVRRSLWPFLVAFEPQRDTPGKGGDRKERAFSYVVRAAESKAMGLPVHEPWVRDWLARICAGHGIGQDTKDSCSQLIMRWMLAAETPTGPGVLDFAAMLFGG